MNEIGGHGPLACSVHDYGVVRARVSEALRSLELLQGASWFSLVFGRYWPQVWTHVSQCCKCRSSYGPHYVQRPRSLPSPQVASSVRQPFVGDDELTEIYIVGRAEVQLRTRSETGAHERSRIAVEAVSRLHEWGIVAGESRTGRNIGEAQPTHRGLQESSRSYRRVRFRSSRWTAFPASMAASVSNTSPRHEPYCL